jgi:hypothetical protein
VDRIAAIAREMGMRRLSLHICKQTGNVAVFSRLGFHVVRETPEDPEICESVTGEELTDVYMERPIGQQDSETYIPA